MNSKGFVILPILLVFLVLIGAGTYYLKNKNSDTLPLPSSSPNDSLSQPTPQPGNLNDPTADWETYTDTDNIFSIKYPKNWYYFGLPHDNLNIPGGKFVIFSSTLGNTSPQTHSEDEDARLYITFTPNTESENVREWLEGSELWKYEVKEITISGKPALSFSLPPGEDDAGLSTQLPNYLTTPKWSYAFWGSVTHNSKYDTNMKIIQNMIDSIKINE